MRRVVTGLGVVPVVGTLMLAMAGGAAAAPGEVFQHAPDGEELYVDDPVSFICYRGLGNGTTIVNNTGGTLLLFTDPSCKEKAFDPLQPGEIREGWAGGSFYSVT